MKTGTWTIKSLLAGMLLAGALASCSNEEEPVRLMNPREMLNGNKQIVVRWNGELMDEASAYVNPTEGDSSALGIRLYGIMPDYEAMLSRSFISFDVPFVPLQVTPRETDILFDGILETSKYKLSVQGAYTSGSLEVECDYEITEGIQTGQPYVLPLDDGHFEWRMNVQGTVEWEGETYTKMDFIQMVWDKVLARLAEETPEVRMTFHEDGLADIDLRHAFGTDFTPWMTVRYWYAVNNLVCLALTREQVHEFYDQWTGEPKIYTTPFYEFGNDSQLLPLFYTPQEDTGHLYWGISSTSMFHIMYMYLEAKGLEGLSEREREELALFDDIIHDMHVERKSEFPLLYQTMDRQ